MNKTVDPIVWVEVEDVTWLRPFERVRVVDVKGQLFDGFVREDGPFRLESDGWAVVVCPGVRPVGGLEHAPAYGDRFYREFGW